MMRGDEVSEAVREFGGYEKMMMGMEVGIWRKMGMDVRCGVVR